MAMITTVELNDPIAPGERAREANTRHSRFRAAVYHPHLLDRWHPTADPFRHLHFQRIWNPKTQAARRGFAYRVYYHIRRVTEDRRSPASHVVDVFLPID